MGRAMVIAPVNRTPNVVVAGLKLASERVVPAAAEKLLVLNGRVRFEVPVRLDVDQIRALAFIEIGLATGAFGRLLAEKMLPPFRTTVPVPSPNVAVAFRPRPPALM